MSPPASPAEGVPVTPAVFTLLQQPKVDDLLTLCSFHYGTSSGPKLKILFSPRVPGLNHSLELTRSQKTGQILTARIRPLEGVSFSSALVELESFLRETIQALSMPLEHREATRLLFVHSKVKGDFNLVPHFRLSEPPVAAPMPPWPVSSD